MHILEEIQNAVDEAQVRVYEDYVNGRIDAEKVRRIVEEQIRLGHVHCEVSEVIRGYAFGRFNRTWHSVMESADQSIEKMVEAFARCGISEECAWRIIDAWTSPDRCAQ